MKTIVPNRLRTLAAVTAAALLSLGGPTASAATLSFSTTAPTPGASDVYNLAGAPNDGANVRDAGTYADGAGNDAFTYVAPDRANQGQTFTTGANAGGYAVAAVWVQHAGYSSNTNLTWYRQATGSVFRIRVTRPSQVGTAGFVFDDETYTITGTEPNKLPEAVTNSANGTGTWMKFTFATPVVLSPSTVYGFDLCTGSGNNFLELAGTGTDVVAGGSAYKGTALGGTPDNTLTALNGDRVFLVELAPVGTSPSFVTQPEAFTGSVGADVTLTASATGSPAPTYQWQKSTNGGTNWNDVFGATGASLDLNPAAYADNGLYRVVATNTAGSATSNAVAVTLTYPAPVITVGSSSTTVLDGTDVSLSVTATGVGPLTYQWYLEGSPISGATASSLALGTVTSSAAGSYSVVVTDPAATADGLPATTTTREIELAVIPSSTATVAYYRFEDGTDDATIATATDSAGTDPMGTSGAPVFASNVPLATVPRTGAANLHTARFPSTANNGFVASTGGALASTAFTDFTIEFYVRLANLNGWQTFVGRDDTASPGEGVGSEALLYIQKAGGVTGSGANNGFRIELITKDSRNLQLHSTYVPNIDTWYHVAVVGSSLAGTLSLYVDGALIQSVPGFNGLFVPSSGADAPWTIGRGEFDNNATDFFQGYLDEVRFSQVALPPSRFLRSDSSSDLPPPVISSAPQHATARVGTAASFSVTATGQGNLSYQWYYNGSPLSGQTSATLTLNSVTTGSVGTYSVTVSDDAGVSSGYPPTTATAQATLQVVDVPLPSRALSLNFVGASTGFLNYATDLGSLASGEAAGFLAVANWNNSATENAVATSPAALPLVENTGAAGLATATWNSANTWAALASGGTAAGKAPDRRLFHGYIESRAATGASVTVSNIPYASYDVYVYVAGGTSGNVGSLSLDRVGSPTYYYRLIASDSFASAATPLPFMLGAATSLAEAQGAPLASFVRFAGVTGDSLAITAKDAVLNANAGGIAAISIVDRTPAGSPYPPSVTTLPVSQLKAGGSSASFTVSAVSNNSGGVLSYQWQKDGVNIGGQTSATLSLSGLTGSSTGTYSVVITDNSSLGAASTTRNASLVVVDATRPLLINGDLKASGVATFTGNGILRTTGSSNADLGVGTTVWNSVLGASGTATRSLTKESTGLTLPGVSFTYAGAEGVEDNTAAGFINGTAMVTLSRDYLYTDNQTTPLTGSISGLDALVGQEVTLVVYAYGKLSTAFNEAVTSDTATVTLATANNHLGSAPYATSTGSFEGRNIVDNNLISTSGATSAYATFTGVVAPGGTVNWSIGPDSDAGRIPLVGFQLLLTGNNLAPAVPTGLAAVGGNNQVSLTWSAVSGADTYTIGRSTTSGGPYTTISAGLVTGTSYTDNSAVNGTTYYYVVASAKTSPAVQSAYSAEASVTLGSGTTPLQSWRQTHFGTTANTGNAANTADPDGDGLVNLLEYALGTNPTVAAATPVTVGQSGGTLTLTFSPVVDANLSYAIEASSDLAGAWSVVHTYGSFASTAPVTYTDSVVLSSVNSKRFLRLKVTSTE